MALSSTIYKFTITLSDLNRDYYQALNLTVALHPSENTQRMMARVLAYCLHADEHLQFTKGLSTPEEPDIWCKTLDGQTLSWIEIGEPAADKLKKASRVAKEVWVYTFNSKSAVWWQQEQAKISPLAVYVRQFNWPEIETLSAMLERKMEMSVTVSGDAAFVACDKGECEVHWQVLQD
ncbi:Uncharacterized conserved protein YaeQ, suppresses RfaH defect [Alteromonadaceae bacterium Bs31]|nr:Uncharacterized conserved protein YaeQ, suppresses RfaH defect [Alteromonadaceae bacterium Bs31]